LVATARDKLIAEWHERLAAAEAADTDSISRPAWLARLQIRLYRFLLSLYSNSDWTTTPPRKAVRKSDGECADDSVVFASPTVLPLSGKPPKTIGQIQSVLKTVTSAQSSPPQSGPLTQGLAPDCWITIQLVAQKHWPRMKRYEDALQRHGIKSQLQYLGGRYSLEVQANDRNEAAQILAAEPPPPAPIRRKPSFRLIRFQSIPFARQSLVVGMVVGPLVGYLAAIGADNALRLSMEKVDAPFAAVVAAFVGTVVAAAASLVIMSVVPTVLAIPELCSRLEIRRRRFYVRQRNLRQLVGDLLWHWLALGVMLAPFVGFVSITIAGAVSSPERTYYFFIGWWGTLVAGTLVFFIRPLRWLIPWLN
jgi:hypothetical protein